MKTFLIAFLSATLLGFASTLAGRSFATADFVACVVAISLVAWTIEQYGREPRALRRERPIRLPIQTKVASPAVRSSRMAA